MKTLKTTVVALALLLTTSVFANFSRVVKTPEKASEEISLLLGKPDFLVTQSKTVMVEFVLNKDKELVVLSIGCDEADICNFIKEGINRKTLSADLEQGKVYELPVKFVSKD